MKLFAIAAAILPLAGCVETASEPVGMGNPASIHCESLGGHVEIRKEAGGESGYCHLPDGRVVEEWELFRSKK